MENEELESASFISIRWLRCVSCLLLILLSISQHLRRPLIEWDFELISPSRSIFFNIRLHRIHLREWAQFEFHSFHLMNFVCQNERFLFTSAFFFYITCHSLGEMSFSRAAALPFYSNFKISSKHWPVRIHCLYLLGTGYRVHTTLHSTHTRTHSSR